MRRESEVITLLKGSLFLGLLDGDCHAVWWQNICAQESVPHDFPLFGSKWYVTEIFFFFSERLCKWSFGGAREKFACFLCQSFFFFFWGVGAGEEETSNNNNKQQNMHTKKQTTNLPSHAGKKGRKQDLPTVIRITGWTFLPLSFQKR